MKDSTTAVVRTIRRTKALGAALVLAALAATSLVAQETRDEVPTELTLERAVDLARRNNPGFLRTENDASQADWAVREAYGSFLPSASVSVGGGYRGTGEVRVGTITLDNQVTDWMSSNYNLGFSWRLDGSTIFGLSNARASRRATDARITAAEFGLESAVTAAYMSTLRAQEGVGVAQRQLERATQSAQIVSTRVAAGAAAGTDRTQADVDLGRAEVAVIQAERNLRQMRLLLAEALGVPLQDDVVLASTFEVFEPAFSREELLDTAFAAHPSLSAARAQEDASRAQARSIATSQWLPSLSVNGGWSGYTQQALNDQYVLGRVQSGVASAVRSCEFNNALELGISGGIPNYSYTDCSLITVTPQMEQAALAANETFPLDFSRNPFQVGLSVSLPIFTGFSRERQISQMNNAAEDAELTRREQELAIETLVTAAYDNLVSAYRVVQVESNNRELAQRRQELEQQRYALGASQLLLLMDAESSLSLAEQQYLSSVYDFHYNLIALEAAVGMPLRPR